MIYHSNGSILHLLEFEANHIFHIANDGDVCSFEHSFLLYFQKNSCTLVNAIQINVLG